jgi:hypothetical protein
MCYSESMWTRLLLLYLCAASAHAADICDPVRFGGPYAFLLSGMTAIGSAPQPTVSIGRIIFDGSGKISGTSSATFSGLLLGNPVTGSYEARRDCTLNWQLQDDSGAFQHFTGKLSGDAARIPFRQTDPGGTSGVMQRTADNCSSTDLKRNYEYTVAGVIKAMNPGYAGRDVSARGVLDTARGGDFKVDSDCSVHFSLNLPDGAAKMRGFLVNGGKEILGFQTDPGAMVSVRLLGR